MRNITLKQSCALRSFLNSKSDFVFYETIDNCFVISVRDDQQLFWLGVSYGEFFYSVD